MKNPSTDKILASYLLKDIIQINTRNLTTLTSLINQKLIGINIGDLLLFRFTSRIDIYDGPLSVNYGYDFKMHLDTTHVHSIQKLIGKDTVIIDDYSCPIISKTKNPSFEFRLDNVWRQDNQPATIKVSEAQIEIYVLSKSLINADLGDIFPLKVYSKTKFVKTGMDIFKFEASLPKYVNQFVTVSFNAIVKKPGDYPDGKYNFAFYLKVNGNVNPIKSYEKLASKAEVSILDAINLQLDKNGNLSIIVNLINCWLLGRTVKDITQLDIKPNAELHVYLTK